MPREREIEVGQVAHHRNGISGEPFYVVTFKYRGELYRDMVAVVFPQEGRVAVLDVNLLVEGKVGPYENSWRGDRFEPELRAAVRRWQNEASRPPAGGAG